MDISKKDEKKNPMYFVNPIIKNKNNDLSTYEEDVCQCQINLQRLIDHQHVKLSI